VKKQSHRPLFDTVLITGCGGDIAISMARILSMTGAAKRLVGCDIHDDHPGFAFFDCCHVVPRCGAPAYMEAVGSIVRKENVEVVLVASEPELRWYAEVGLAELGGIPVVKANSEALAIGFDKLATAEALQDWGLLSPTTVDAACSAPRHWPAVLKTRCGSGSKSVRIVQGPREAPGRGEMGGYIWQELLLPEDQEYTCGLYRSGTNDIRSIILRRKLVGGLTGSGAVAADPEIETLLQVIAERLQLRGSINVQLRRTSRGPVVFEINPRFSSTLLFRHLLGFTDLIWTLEEMKGLRAAPYTAAPAGTKFYRVGAEVLLPVQAASGLEEI
jgi:carbamoyl-phosphate synthase large subunit